MIRISIVEIKLLKVMWQRPGEQLMKGLLDPKGAKKHLKTGGAKDLDPVDTNY